MSVASVTQWINPGSVGCWRGYNARVSVSPGPTAPAAPRLLQQVRDRARYRHYSLQTEKAYVYWIRFFVRWSGLRHPREMDENDVQAFLTMLANERRVSASTRKQALSTLLFLYREVLGIELPWMEQLQRPTTRKRIPAVLTADEIGRLLQALDGTTGLVAKML
jgi:site-specific recombinase XerD